MFGFHFIIKFSWFSRILHNYIKYMSYFEISEKRPTTILRIFKMYILLLLFFVVVLVRNDSCIEYDWFKAIWTVGKKKKNSIYFFFYGNTAWNDFNFCILKSNWSFFFLSKAIFNKNSSFSILFSCLLFTWHFFKVNAK